MDRIQTPIDVSRLGRGFDNVVLASQAAFHEVMWAMARPGLSRRLDAAIEPPTGLEPATAIGLLTLADFETPVWLDADLARGAAGDYVRFHTGCPLVSDPAGAQFAVARAADATDLLRRLPVGEDRYPDRSATLFVEVPALTGGVPVRLTGPGIDGTVEIAPAGLDQTFWQAVADNHALYPLGVDLVLVAGHEIIALPRSTAPKGA